MKRLLFSLLLCSHFALAQIYSNNHHLSKKTSPANGLTKITPPARLPCLQKEGLILLIILFQRYCTPRPEIVNSLKKEDYGRCK